ncbi:MAG: ABC transporter ATP-binding protein [Clostridia bacterium]|nr:ABC transporter ATP-binding protein [Clostridia bacterium]
MNLLRRYAGKYLRLFICAIAFLSLEAGCDLMQPTVMSWVVDNGIGSRNLALVLRYGGLMLLITAVGAFAAVMRNFISSNVSQGFGADLRGDLYQKIHSLSFDQIDRFEPATLITRLTNDVTQLQNFVNGMMRIFVKAPLMCIGAIIMAMLINFRLSLIVLAVMPLIIVLIVFNTRLAFPFFRRLQGAIDRVNGVMREFLSGIRVVRAFNRSGFEQQRFNEANAGLSDIQKSAMRTMAVFSPGIALAVNLGAAAVLWAGGYRVNGGSMRVGQVMAFANYMIQILSALMMISSVFTNFVRAKASTQRIDEVMRAQSSIVKPESPVAPQCTEIAFEDVTFRYSGADEPALRSLSFRCGVGETVGVIGTTGSGKTSLVSLIPRFYDATQGTVRIGGTDIRLLDDTALREKVAVVPQKNTLFTGTIAENIRWGNPSATDEEVRRAAAAAQADEFIEDFPEGYGTVLGQGGVNLSGGQKQRISIARALVRRPEILILDDCTSAVDVITEAKIRQGLRQLQHSLICIIISQRIASVMAADRILVLSGGELMGAGSHAELLQSCPIYRDIYESQYGRGDLPGAGGDR